MKLKKGIDMTRITIAVVWALALSSFRAAAGESLFRTPIISISPRSIDFGEVRSKQSVTNWLVVENWGGGTLVGKATVKKPFKILSGASYQLRPGDAQVVTIIYTPSAPGMDTNVVKFSGGGGAIAPVTGRLASIPDREK